MSVQTFEMMHVEDRNIQFEKLTLESAGGATCNVRSLVNPLRIPSSSGQRL